MRKLAWSVCLALLAVHSSPVRAHFKLLAPDSWLNEGSDGSPQKGAPCGPGGSDDTGTPPMSMKVTEVHAGDMLAVEIEETVHHSGWFRISLSEDRSAFQEIEFPNSDCTVDMSTVPTGAHDNVLADGLAMDTQAFGNNRMIKEMVKIPDMPCEKCTLQVIQVMADTIHSPPGCIYYHCADLKILPAGEGATGSAPAGTSGGTAGASSGAAGMTDAAAGAPAGTAGTAAPSGTAGAAAGSSAAASGSAGAAGMSRPTTTPSTGAAGKPSTGSSTNATTGNAMMAAAAAGSPAMTNPPAEPPAEGGGCSATRVGSDSSALGFVLCLGFAVAWRTRTRSRKRTRAA